MEAFGGIFYSCGLSAEIAAPRERPRAHLNPGPQRDSKKLPARERNKVFAPGGPSAQIKGSARLLFRKNDARDFFQFLHAAAVLSSVTCNPIAATDGNFRFSVFGVKCNVRARKNISACLSMLGNVGAEIFFLSRTLPDLTPKTENGKQSPIGCGNLCASLWGLWAPIVACLAGRPRLATDRRV